jgi:MEDS: MEthanogen/methylotroph, DcmR Sensory domain
VVAVLYYGGELFLNSWRHVLAFRCPTCERGSPLFCFQMRRCKMFAIIRPHRIDFSGIKDFPVSSWDQLLAEIGALSAPGRTGRDQRILFSTDQAFVFVWSATNSQLKEILGRFGVTAYTEEELKASDEAKRRLTLRDSRKKPTSEPNARHQCHIYDGSPSHGLAKMAAALRRRLSEGYRCLYLNSPTMIEGMSSYLGASGTDVEREISRSNLIMSSDQSHLVSGLFDLDRMMDSLERDVIRAMHDGYKGLWAAGDMAWEFGSEQNFVNLLAYEWRLEDLFRRQPGLSGVCQYHAATVPREALLDGLVSHSTLFVNAAGYRVNPHYIASESLGDVAAADRMKLDNFVTALCAVGN